MAAANPGDALDVGLSASGFKKADHDALNRYIMAQQPQHSSSSSVSEDADSECEADCDSEGDDKGCKLQQANEAAKCGTRIGFASGDKSTALEADV